jgi:hypothetical protein
MKHVAVPTDDLRERFILFLASKPADLAYNWNSITHCACGTFIRERLTKTTIRWGFRRVQQLDQAEANRVWKRWNSEAEICPRTYGALLQRVRASATSPRNS